MHLGVYISKKNLAASLVSSIAAKRADGRIIQLAAVAVLGDLWAPVCEHNSRIEFGKVVKLFLNIQVRLWAMNGAGGGRSGHCWQKNGDTDVLIITNLTAHWIATASRLSEKTLVLVDQVAF